MLATTIGGLMEGGTYALLGLCTLLTYRLVSVVNFTQCAVGALGAYAMVIPHEHGVPVWLSVVFGLIAGAVAHGVIGFLMVRFLSEGSEEVKAAVTVVLFGALTALGGILFGIAKPRAFPEPTGSPAFTVADVVITWTTVLIIGVAVLFTIIPILVLSKTRIGLWLRAVAAKPMTSQLAGLPAPRLAMGVWLVTGALTAFAIMVVAPRVPNDYGSLSQLIVWAFAAVLLSAFRSFWITLVGGLALGALGGFLVYFQDLSVYRGAIPLAVIVLVLLWNQRNARWDAAA